MTRFRIILRRLIEEPSRVWRYAWFLISGWIYPRCKRRSVTLFLGAGGGLGDNLMLTTVAREVRKRNPHALIHVIANRTSIFDRNPDVDFVSSRPTDRSRFRDFFVFYTLGFPWKKHLAQYMCDCVNVRGPAELKTYIFPSAEDFAWAEKIVARFGAAPILIHRTSNSHGFRKTWPVAHWQQLVRELTPSAPVVEIGRDGEPLAIVGNGYHHILGETTPHQLAALMSKARAFVTVDSGPMHMAAAFDLPTVCILGGVFPDVAIRYPHSRVLANRPACANCWPQNHCDFNVQCMSAIKVADVLNALHELSPTLRTTQTERPQLSTFTPQPSAALASS